MYIQYLLPKHEIEIKKAIEISPISKTCVHMLNEAVDTVSKMCQSRQLDEHNSHLEAEKGGKWPKPTKAYSEAERPRAGHKTAEAV